MKTIHSKTTAATCYHCGESCRSEIVQFDNHSFCCNGCKMIYDLLKENSLCTYYNLNAAPGISPGTSAHQSRYDYLDHEQIRRKLIRYSDEKHTHIVFHIPGIHCSSCIWLLENLHKLNPGVISSTVNFIRKEATVIYNPETLKLSEVAALLSHIGYEPLISQNDLEEAAPQRSKTEVIKIGLAGFCFGNIMMLSFPEYFAFGDFHEQQNLSYFFGYLNLLLALPVFFYAASGFFVSAWKSIRHRYLNIDAPIALAILVTFVRSVYEIVSHSGTGYMDSMTGIVFFMLVGRYFQNKTYETLSFERDYKSYFPVGVTVRKSDGQEVNQPVSDLAKGDKIVIRNNELVPADSVLLSEQTHIDYSFITGESEPVKVLRGQLVYAGGKQLGGAIDLQVMQLTSQSYLTQLWNEDKQSGEPKDPHSFTDKINKYFTSVVLAISALSATYWLFVDPSKALNALTAVLIVACPCGLLLTTTFANGNILRIMGRNKLYLKNAAVIEKLAQADTILFDKTGTIAHGSSVEFAGAPLSKHELRMIASLAAQSSHPLSRMIYAHAGEEPCFAVESFVEIPGTGITGSVDGRYIVLGSEYFVVGSEQDEPHSTRVLLMIDGEIMGYFSFRNVYRKGLRQLVKKLEKHELKIVSGDNDAERKTLQSIFGKKVQLLFHQKPEQKMEFVNQLRMEGKNVMMIGDGLNDAGALKQSDIGIAVSDNTNNFSPACEAILDGESLVKLPAFIRLSRAARMVIIATFVISLAYNLVGLSFAVQGILSPVVAAILMPASSISIVLLTTISTSIAARIKGL